MQPITQNNPNLHKGPSSSTDFNRLRNDIHHDLVALFDLANRHDEEIRRNMDVLIHENFFMQNRLIELENYIEKIEADTLNRQSGISRQTLVKSFHSLAGLFDGDPEKEALVNTMYGCVTIPHSDVVSKIMHKADDGTVIVPESLQIELRESNNTREVDSATGIRSDYVVDDDGVMLAFDGDKNSFWVHTSTFPEDSGVSEVYGNVHIKLPLDVLNNAHANTLTINPFPEYGLTIRDIIYKGHGEQWFRLETYPTEKAENGMESPVEIKDASKLIFSFPKTEITELQIKFAQPYWFENEKQREFVYGFQEIELENRAYTRSEAEIVTEFSLEGTTKRFYTIAEPVVQPVVGSAKDINDLVQHKLYYNKELSNEFNFGNEIMANLQKIYIKTIIRSQGGIVPMIKKLNLEYTFRDMNQV